MNLKVRIHSKEYEIAQGATFSEEYNETLDSGAIRIPHVVGQIDNLRPYDDVYIYDSKYDFDEHIAEWRQGGEYSDNPFYRHLLVNQYTEEVVNLDTIDPETNKKGILSYSIELFSETKGLEMVQVPNCSVTQPLNIKKKTDIYTYLCRFVNRYSPKYKTVDRTSTSQRLKWTYAKKYSVSPELKEIFGGVYSQDFTLSNPTLRDVLSTLMITKDMIPYVKDNVIYAKAISERTDTYNIEEQKRKGKINLVVGQMSSADYCDGVRRQYSDALSQDGTCNFIEYLGFRNKDNALMTLDNMQVETTHKIYRIKKFHMCYYKRAIVVDFNTHETKEVWFLCKQDITPLIKLKSEWGMLSQDWREVKEATPKTIKDLAKYKITTVAYDIGGTVVSGWGTRYNEYKESSSGLSIYDITKTYIENIYALVDEMFPFGIVTEQEAKEYYKEHYGGANCDIESIGIFPSTPTRPFELGIETNVLSNLYSPEKDVYSTLKFKTFFFEIEYSGFYDGALIHSRDKGNDNLFQNDNQSSSLTLLEKDGFSQKEKLNRFANKTYTMKGRLDGANYGVDKLLKLGQTGQIGEDDDVIIYRREYSIYDNYILASYAGVQDYVLKNFYTSVYAKYRTNQLMSYGESTNRAETRKSIFLLSKNSKYRDDDCFFKIINQNDDVTYEAIFSAFSGNNENKTINRALIILDKNNYFVDLQTFVSGNSLCFNIAMNDNASGGNFIENRVAKYKKLSLQPSDDENYYVGSTQAWLNIVDDVETGEIENIGFEVSHGIKNARLIADSTDHENYVKNIYDYSSALPKKTLDTRFDIVGNTIVIDKEQIFKDNKDKIDMTIQVEPISEDSNDVVIGQYLMKLSDLISYKKYITDVEETAVAYQETYKEIPIRASYYYDKLLIEIVQTEEEVEKLIQEIEEKGVIMTYFSIFRYGHREGDDDSIFYFLAKTISIHYETDGYGNTYKKIKLSGGGRLSVPGWNDESIDSIIFDEWGSTGHDGAHLYYFAPEQFKPQTADEQSLTLPFLRSGQKKTKIERNMFVEFNTTDYINKTYSQKFLHSDIDVSIFKDKENNYYSVSDTFVLHNENGNSYIRVNIPTSFKDTGLKSIRYWYLDFDAAYSKDYTDSKFVYDYDLSKSGYHFVFGVNVTNADIEKGYVDIYITKTTHRDPRVFDSLGRQVGRIHNCVTQNGYIAPEVQEYDNSEHNIPLYVVSASIDPDGSGKIVGNSIYYKGEEATIEFVPNDGNIFYRWKENGEIIKSNPISFVVDKDRSLIAQCGVNYHIWKDNLGIGPLVTNESDVELYKFNREEIEGDILKISATNIEVTTTGSIPLTYFGSFSIDPSVNVSKDTASKAVLLGDVGTVTLKTWFENDKVMFNGYRTYFGKIQPIVVNAPILEAVLVNNPEYGTITLDFSDENIETISYEYYVATDVPGVSNLYSGTITREEATDNKYIIENVPYGSGVNLWATTSDIQNYIPVYSKENPKSSVLGVIIIFKPKSKQITREILWESTDGIGLVYGYDTSGILQAPQGVVFDGLENYLAVGETMSTQYAQFVFDVDGKEKSIIIDHDGNPIAISDEITFTSIGLLGTKVDENSDVVDTALLYVLLTTGATQPTVKLKKIFTPLTE